jgi:hypothetical protein
MHMTTTDDGRANHLVRARGGSWRATARRQAGSWVPDSFLSEGRLLLFVHTSETGSSVHQGCNLLHSLGRLPCVHWLTVVSWSFGNSRESQQWVFVEAMMTMWMWRGEGLWISLPWDFFFLLWSEDRTEDLWNISDDGFPPIGFKRGS